MAFSDYITRIFGKRPVWLYRITVGATEFHYTSKGAGYTTPNDRPTTDYPTGQVWAGATVNRGEIFQSAASNRTDTFIRLLTSDPATVAMRSNKYEDVTVTIWQGYIGDPEDEFVLQFAGRLVRYEGDLLLTTLTFDTDLSDAARSSVAQVVQRPCRHVHYFTDANGEGCRLNLADYQQSAEVTVVSGRSLTIPLAAMQPDGNYLAGVLEYDGKEYMIESHIGEAIVVETIVDGLEAAVALGTTNVLIAEGCNLTIQRCEEFGNLDNHGGFNDMLKSEFDQRSLA